ncbi:hypothetical protein D3C77_419570 [compost metagenome]
MGCAITGTTLNSIQCGWRKWKSVWIPSHHCAVNMEMMSTAYFSTMNKFPAIQTCWKTRMNGWRSCPCSESSFFRPLWRKRLILVLYAIERPVNWHGKSRVSFRTCKWDELLFK